MQYEEEEEELSPQLLSAREELQIPPLEVTPSSLEGELEPLEREKLIALTEEVEETLVCACDDCEEGECEKECECSCEEIIAGYGGGGGLYTAGAGSADARGFAGGGGGGGGLPRGNGDPSLPPEPVTNPEPSTYLILLALLLLAVWCKKATRVPNDS